MTRAQYKKMLEYKVNSGTMTPTYADKALARMDAAPTGSTFYFNCSRCGVSTGYGASWCKGCRKHFWS